jgi:hypothetical protein
MTGATPTPAPKSPDDRLATTIQALYTARGMSLSDPETASAFDVALEAVVLFVDATYRTGGMGEVEHRRLRALLDAARLVPNYLTGTHGA